MLNLESDFWNFVLCLLTYIIYCLICRIEIEENVVNGSFNMIFLGHSISLGYRNHTNIAMR